MATVPTCTAPKAKGMPPSTPAARLMSSNSKEPTEATSTNIPASTPKSPMRFITKALRPALA